MQRPDRHAITVSFTHPQPLLDIDVAERVDDCRAKGIDIVQSCTFRMHLPPLVKQRVELALVVMWNIMQLQTMDGDGRGY